MWVQVAEPEAGNKVTLFDYSPNRSGSVPVKLLDGFKGYLRMDNNLAENAIHPFVVGRKAWLFSNSQAGAHASANLYSLVETAKANGVEPFNYLKEVFARLPVAQSVEDIEQLLHWNYRVAEIKVG